jgi:putative protease
LKRRQKIELLAPAGSFEKLKIAIHYGTDAVYLAGKDFSFNITSSITE